MAKTSIVPLPFPTALLTSRPLTRLFVMETFTGDLGCLVQTIILHFIVSLVAAFRPSYQLIFLESSLSSEKADLDQCETYLERACQTNLYSTTNLAPSITTMIPSSPAMPNWSLSPLPLRL